MPKIDQAFARLTKAESHRRSGDLGRAKALCEALLRDYPDYAGALQTLGVIRLAMNDPRQAYSCFAQVQLLCPADWIDLTNLGTAALRLGAHAAAIEILEKARRLKPDDIEMLRILADAYREARDYEAAVEVSAISSRSIQGRRWRRRGSVTAFSSSAGWRKPQARSMRRTAQIRPRRR